MNGYERRKHKKTAQIFEAALRLTEKYSFGKISVNEIAAAAGVSPATIFNYFGTKENLYTQMLENWADEQIGEYERILGSDLPFPDKIKSIWTAEAGNLKRLYGGMNEIGEPGVWRAAEQGMARKIEAFFVKLIERGKAEGFIPPAYSDETMLKYFGMYMNELKQTYDPRQTDELLTMFFYGLSKPTAAAD